MGDAERGSVVGNAPSAGGGLYRGWHARYYDRIWRAYTASVLAGVRVMIDWPALRAVPVGLGRPPRMLDAGCGTGLLLAQVLMQAPGLEATGVDTSPDMLVRARANLAAWPAARLDLAQLGPGQTANLPYPLGTFDLITCASVLHYLADPAAVLAGIARLLAPGGQLILADFARRPPPFPWPAFEWLLGRLDPQHVHAYSLDEARTLCVRAGLQIAESRAFVATRLWHAWALRAAQGGSRAS